MKKNEKKINKKSQEHWNQNNVSQKTDTEKNGDYPGYPHYPPSEDIYNNEKEVELNPDDLTKKKKTEIPPESGNEKRFSEDMTGEDLDVPGSKADEAQPNEGSEDEENNYYSLGGDDHNDLEEDQGE